MRVLVLTNHFAAFYGSEIVALEVARWFHEHGDNVTLAANYIDNPILAHATGLTLTGEIEALDLSDYDLIWCQHDLLSLLPVAAFERAAERSVPHVALISLSPYEPYEHVDALLARALSADVLVNSPETALEIARRSHGQLASERVRTFHNAAPQHFWRDAPAIRAPRLRSATLISNHAPPELLETLKQLRRKGVRTTHIGQQRERRLVRPEDLARTDAIIAIGKSVPYAIAQRTPVYMYDQFGGDGWLTRANLQLSIANNFSGRPARRRLEADSIVRELIDGYAAAAAEMDLLGDETDLALFSLDAHLSELRRRASEQTEPARPATLQHHLAQPEFLSHLETLRAKSLAMKRNYHQLAQLRR